MKDNSNISQELLETIERYHNKTMTQSERQYFEARLQNDDVFSTLVNDIQTLLFGIEKQSLKEKLDTFHDDLPIRMETEKKESKVRQFHFMKIAAAVVIFMAIGSFWFLSGSSSERLYDSYFSPDPGLPTTMSTSDNFTFYDAMVNYKQGDYEKAISKWKVLEKSQSNNDTLNYFLGVAHMANKNEETAILYLEKTTSNSNSVFLNDANYYLGLAYLKKDDKVSATKFLKLSESENSKEIINKID